MNVIELVKGSRQAKLTELISLGRKHVCKDARLSNMYWIKRSTFTKKLHDKCMVHPRKFASFCDDSEPSGYSMAVGFGAWIGFPPGIGLEMLGIPEDVRINTGQSRPPNAFELSDGFEPRSYQIDTVAKAIRALTTNPLPRCIVSAACGLGKTVIAIMIAAELGRKTAVIVHRQELADQWIDRVSALLPNARIGRVQGKTMDIDDCDVVIMMIQTVIKRIDGATVGFPSIGLTIYDECHHIPARSFSKAVSGFSGAMLGLSATVTRSDGLTWVLKACLGQVVSNLKRDDAGGVTIKLVEFVPSSDDGVWAAASNCVPGDRMFLIARTRLISKLVENDERNALIAKLAREAILNDGRTPILLTERRGHAYELAKLLGEFATCMLVGGKRKKKKKPKLEVETTSSDPQLYVGTYAFATEGLDIHRLNTLLFCTPTTNVTWLTQTIGRIQRGFTDKTPVVIDVCDTPLERMTRRRCEFYKSKKYTTY